VTICHINLARGFRGGERQTELLVRQLGKRGLKQTLVARKNEPLLERLAGTAGLTMEPVIGNAIAALLTTSGGELIHAHESRAGQVAYLRRSLSRTPYVITRRVSNVPKGDFFTRRMYRSSSMCACVAASVAGILQDYDSAIRTTVIHSSTSQLKVDPVAVERIRAVHEGKFLVGHVAALDDKTKGQTYIIRAARELQHSHPQIHFLLIGSGADEDQLRSEAAGLRNLSFTGFVDNPGDYLSVLDVHILPSNIEGIGGVLLDAMSFGLPVVASRVGGLPEIVRHGDNGLLIQPHNPQQLNEAILRLHNDEQLRLAMGARGREFVSDFAPDKMAGKYLDLYESILDRKLT